MHGQLNVKLISDTEILWEELVQYRVPLTPRQNASGLARVWHLAIWYWSVWVNGTVVPVTLPLLPIALTLSRRHSYKVTWNCKPSLWRTKLCSMQQVLTTTLQKSGQMSIAKILHLLHTMTNAQYIFLLAQVNLLAPELLFNFSKPCV